MKDTQFLRFSYMRKSGSHAIMNWVADILGGDVCFFNNRMFRRLVHPLKGQGMCRGDKKFRRLYTPTAQDLSTAFQDRNIILSVEDKDISTMPARALSQVDKPGFDIVILRDVYNWWASTLVEKGRDTLHMHPDPETKNPQMWANYARVIDRKNYSNMDRLAECWIKHAKEALNPGTYLETPSFPILFNHWRENCEYRQSICTRLGGEYSDSTIHHTADLLGKGCDGAFDTLSVYAERAEALPCFYRWEFFMNNPLYWEIFERYPELEKLSAELFGEIIPEREKYPLGELARRFRDEP